MIQATYQQLLDFIGFCELCGFMGVLVRKYRATADDIETNDTADGQLPKMRLCGTCAETPQGVRSENQTHQRLPEGEYKKK